MGEEQAVERGRVTPGHCQRQNTQVRGGRNSKGTSNQNGQNPKNGPLTCGTHPFMLPSPHIPNTILPSHLLISFSSLMHVSKSTLTATTTRWTLIHHLDHSAAFHPQQMCDLLLSKTSWLAEAGVLSPPSPKDLLRNLSWEQVGRFWIILSALSSWSGRVKTSQSFSLIELLRDETTNQLICQSMTPASERLQRGKQWCADVCVCVGIMSWIHRITQVFQKDYAKSPAEIRGTVGLKRRTSVKWMAARSPAQIK